MMALLSMTNNKSKINFTIQEKGMIPMTVDLKGKNPKKIEKK